MTPLELNALGFEGDMILKEEFEGLIQKHNIKAIIETGAYLGNTTLQLAKMVKNVWTVEINEHYYNQALEKFTKDNIPEGHKIHCVCADSIDTLQDMISKAWYYGDVLMFLDDHWLANNPLLEELKIIESTGIKPVIIIHDFRVPDHPELGFDSYNGQDYEWSWIEQSIENIYGKDGYTYYYNSEAEGAKRGVIFIEPK